jgi:type IV pilus assembly protein PilA
MLDRGTRTGQDGFTLVEVLVVCLIIAALAAIAIPVFLGQQSKAQDADAKSNARNLVSHLEACHATSEDYQLCDTAAELGTTGLDIGSGQGQVEVTTSCVSSYTIVGHSKSGNNFTITKGTDGAVTRSCTNAGSGSCLSSGTW